MSNADPRRKVEFAFREETAKPVETVTPFTDAGIFDQQTRYLVGEVQRLTSENQALKEEIAKWPKCYICKERYPGHRYDCPDR